MNIHKNARLTPHIRANLVRRVEGRAADGGRPQLAPHDHPENCNKQDDPDYSCPALALCHLFPQNKTANTLCNPHAGIVTQ